MKEVDMSGKTCVITGANTGIGREAALSLAEAGATLLLAGRSRERTEPVIDEINSRHGEDRATFIELDLGDLESVRRGAEEILEAADTIDVLINNAGIGGGQGVTKDGFEIHFGINHLGHFLLTNLLLDRLRESAPSRIVTVASRAHKRVGGIDFDALREPTKSKTGMREYCVSKLANVLFSAELARRLEGTGVSTYALHPGVVASDIWRKVPGILQPLIKLFMISTEEGAVSTIHCATCPDIADKSGLYWDELGRVKEPTSVAQDRQLAAELWRRSEEWVGVGA